MQTWADYVQSMLRLPLHQSAANQAAAVSLRMAMLADGCNAKVLAISGFWCRHVKQP